MCCHLKTALLYTWYNSITHWNLLKTVFSSRRICNQDLVGDYLFSENIRSVYIGSDCNRTSVISFSKIMFCSHYYRWKPVDVAVDSIPGVEDDHTRISRSSGTRKITVPRNRLNFQTGFFPLLMWQPLAFVMDSVASPLQMRVKCADDKMRSIYAESIAGLDSGSVVWSTCCLVQYSRWNCDCGPVIR